MKNILNSTIGSILSKKGFKLVSPSQPIKNLPWQPNFITKKNGEINYFLIRQTNDIPETIISRISQFRRTKNEKYAIVFNGNPSVRTKKLLSASGIKCYVYNDKNNSELIDIGLKLEKAKVVKKKIPSVKKMKKTEIFISSHQIIQERKAIRDLILQHQKNFPVYPFQVEDDPRFGNQTKKCIDEGLRRSDWFIGILADDYRHWVNYEIKNAISSCFQDDEIIIYVKNSKDCNNSWKDLLKWIQKQKNIKYFPYSNKTDLIDKLNLNLLQHIEREHKKLKISMYS